MKIVTRLDAVKEYVLGYMDTERYRNANPAESRPDDAPVALDESEQVLSDLRRIAGRAGLESAIAEREFAANFLGFSNSVPKVPTPDGAVLDAIATNRKKIVTRLVALRQRAFDGMGAEQAGPILEDLRYVAEYTGLEEEIAMREEAAELASQSVPPSSLPRNSRRPGFRSGAAPGFSSSPKRKTPRKDIPSGAFATVYTVHRLLDEVPIPVSETACPSAPTIAAFSPLTVAPDSVQSVRTNAPSSADTELPPTMPPTAALSSPARISAPSTAQRLTAVTRAFSVPS